MEKEAKVTLVPNHIVILSPHVDDAALSLGGSICKWRD